ncbi:hypothetical protein [Blastococcus sp. SYSU D01042]
MEFMIWLLALPFICLGLAIFAAGAVFMVPLLVIFGVPAFALTIGAWPIAIAWLLGVGVLSLKNA